MLVGVDAVVGSVVEAYGRPAANKRCYVRIEIASEVLSQQGIMPQRGSALVLSCMPHGREYKGAVKSVPRLSAGERAEVDDICRFLDSDI